MRYLQSALTLLVLLPAQAWCQVALSGSPGYSVFSSTTTTTSCGGTHDGGTSPTVAVACVLLDAGLITNIPTYGGVNGTLVLVGGTGGDSTDQKIACSYWPNPPTGSQTLAMTHISDDHDACIIATFSGTDSVIPVHRYVGNTSETPHGFTKTSACTLTSGSEMTASIDSGAPGGWVMAVGSVDGGDSDPFSASCTSDISSDDGSITCTEIVDGATGTSTTADDGYFAYLMDASNAASDTTITVTANANDECTMILMAIRPPFDHETGR